MELSLYSLCTDHTENSLYCCNGVFATTLHSGGHGADHIENAILLLLPYVYLVTKCLTVSYLATLWPSTLQYCSHNATSSACYKKIWAQLFSNHTPCTQFFIVKWDFMYCVRICGVSVTGVLDIHETSKMKQSLVAHEKDTRSTVLSWRDCNIQQQKFFHSTVVTGINFCTTDTL
jgi:hypothetical protein